MKKKIKHKRLTIKQAIKLKHVCDKACLRSVSMFGRKFYWCEKYSLK